MCIYIYIYILCCRLYTRCRCVCHPCAGTMLSCCVVIAPTFADDKHTHTHTN